MRFSQYYQRLGLSGGWSRELWLTAIALATGFGLMPMLIYALGSSILGRYEGASLGRTFQSIYAGIQSGSTASWIVLLGPYGLYLIFRGLRLLWRASARLA
jgi:hypothetical protein